ncbi:hypothetical protein Ga0074812_11831 [Parafrankia irregularis]|uniref:Uncharacterized protein n=1 Tax=Parafrankia irregularis TaxID=795642 RepID=A0A0S4QRY6_9ACTN|nr:MULTISPECIES: hypothetical protein [Parafrankia]MBE3201780.1 hypothetical protein [Parafrankia sp. CH37]CUU58259.1 hypothetical protein Ga0074812_11831 [Parafrankia irregularis]
MVSYPQYNLELSGWDHQSVWGFDPASDSLYAQLTRNGSGWDAESQGPEVWLSPPWHAAMPTPAALAGAISNATGCTLDSARTAMNESLPDSDHPLYQHPLRRPLTEPAHEPRPHAPVRNRRRDDLWSRLRRALF